MERRKNRVKKHTFFVLGFIATPILLLLPAIIPEKITETVYLVYLLSFGVIAGSSLIFLGESTGKKKNTKNLILFVLGFIAAPILLLLPILIFEEAAEICHVFYMLTFGIIATAALSCFAADE